MDRNPFDLNLEQKYLLRLVLTVGAVMLCGWLGHEIVPAYRHLAHLIETLSQG
jgi:hypothetical protein